MKAELRPASEMKDSGIECIGQIPIDWITRKIKYGFTVISGATPKSDVPEYWDGDIIWVTPADYKTSDVYVSNGRKALTQPGYDSCGTTIVPAGSLIFAKRAPIGTVAINCVPLCTNQGCLSCVPNTSAWSKYYYYSMSVFTELFEVYGAGTLFKEISALNFANIVLPYPDVPTQQAIADYLDDRCSKIDEIIAEATTSIEEYKKLKQAVIFEAVTKGLDKNAPMKDSGVEWIGSIPKHWDFVSLKRIYDYSNGAAVRVGPFGSALPSSAFVDDGVWVYNQRTVIDSNFDTNNTFVTRKMANELSGFKVSPGDVLITTRGSVGKIAIVPKNCHDGILHPCIIRFRVNKNKYSVELLKYLFNESDFMLSQILRRSNATIIDVLYSYNLKELKIPVMPLSEQKKIVEYLSYKVGDMNALISEKQSLIEDLQAYKKSLIYEVVTGKRRVV